VQKVINNFNLALRYIQEVPNEVLNGFTCGRTQLDSFLKEDARQYQDLGLTTTVLAFVDGYDGIAGFFSLSADAVLLRNSEQFELGLLGINFPIKYIPAVKITKLAVSCSLQNQKIGHQLINLICGLTSINDIAIRLLTVDAVNTPGVIAFYESAGFTQSISEEKERSNTSRETVLMFKDLFAN